MHLFATCICAYIKHMHIFLQWSLSLNTVTAALEQVDSLKISRVFVADRGNDNWLIKYKKPDIDETQSTAVSLINYLFLIRFFFFFECPAVVV